MMGLAYEYCIRHTPANSARIGHEKVSVTRVFDRLFALLFSMPYRLADGILFSSVGSVFLGVVIYCK
jgi:hypothetical protein